MQIILGNKMNNEIMFLFGSGISYSSGMPNVNEITNSILNDSWRKAKNGIYFESPEKNEVLDEQKFLKFVKNEIKNSFSDTRSPSQHITYEDLYSILQQIDELLGGISNCAASAFLYNIYRNARHILPRQDNERPYSSCHPDMLLYSSKNFISWAVASLLKKSKTVEIQGFNLFDEISNCSEVSDIDIFSLNHDLLIERYLKDRLGMNFKYLFDGIEIFDNKYIDRTKKFHLYKLHGSINWFTVLDQEKKIYNIIKPEDYIGFSGIELYKNKTNYKLNNPEPQILTGSTVKEHIYSFGIYFYMFNKFHNSLDKKNILIASGYGWNDAGINRRILHWLQYYPNSKLILLHNTNESPIPDFINFHICSNCLMEHKFIHVNKWFKDCHLDDILAYIR